MKKKADIALRVLAGLQVALCLAAALWACGNCSKGNLGLLGAAFYAVLLIALLARRERAANLLICAAVATHLALLWRMASTGPACGWCVAAAAGAFAMAVLRCVSNPGMPRAFGISVLPLTMLASIISCWVTSPSSAEEILSKDEAAEAQEDAPAREIEVIVYENPDCPYCRRFRNRTAPALKVLIGGRLRITYRDARANPAVRVTPTIILRRGDETAVFEGLPPLRLMMTRVRLFLAVSD